MDPNKIFYEVYFLFGNSFGYYGAGSHGSVVRRAGQSSNAAVHTPCGPCEREHTPSGFYLVVSFRKIRRKRKKHISVLRKQQQQQKSIKA